MFSSFPQLRSLMLASILGAGLGLGVLVAAPDNAGLNITPPFTAKELQQGYSDQKLLAMPVTSAAGEDLSNLETAAGFAFDREFKNIDGLRVLRVPPGMTVSEARATLAASGLYEFVEYDQIKQVAAPPSDPDFADGSQWHHQNSGQSSGTIGADIGSIAAWDIRNSASNVIVAVIDSGARLSHRDIGPNLWINPNEIPGNGRDDDRNGYVDDVHGINARDGSGNPNDPPEEGHGTHVSGIIGAAANNGIGGAGVAWQVQLMPLKFLGGPNGSGSTSDEIECIDYAIDHGADVINASYGALGVDGGFGQSQLRAIQRARAAGIVFVAASGNESLNLDLSRAYPASYEIDNLLAVGNGTRLDDRATSSNTGSGAVDLFAPGSEIVSTSAIDDTSSVSRSGTSMAAPMVAGAVALLKAQFPQDDYRATINRLLRGTRPSSDFAGHSITGGRLNVADALLTTDFRPFHDDFADRAMLVGNIVKARSSTSHASTESGEPAHAGRLSRSLWFSWTAPAAGEVSFDTRGSEGDTVLAVYTGDALNSLNRIADNDNESAGFLSSRVAFEAAVGTTYQIAVDSSAAGLVVLNITAALANDAFASAQPLDGDAPLITTTNANATSEPGEPRHVAGSNRQSLWYSWEAPQSGTHQVSVYSQTVDTAVAVYTGTAVNNLTLVGSNDDSGPNDNNLNALVDFEAVEDTVYYIAVDSLGAEEGELTLSITDAVWQYATGDRADLSDRRPTVTNAPTVGPDGTIYASSSDGFFYALNPDGTLRWRVATQGNMDSNGAALSADGTLYFGTNQGVAYALDASDGSERWTSTAGNSPYFAGVAVAADGSVYFKQDEGVLRAFTAAGQPRWTYRVPGEPSYSGPVVRLDGSILFPANDGALHALSPAGDLLWRFAAQREDGSEDSSGTFTSPSIDGAGNIYASTLNGTVYSITSEGALRWVFRTPESGENVTSSLALGDGRAYFASYGGFLYALDQNNGNQIWRSSIEAQARASSPAIAADGSIVVGSYANKLFRFDRDGALIRAWSAGNWFRSSPVLADGRIYVGNGDGKIYAFDLGGVGPAPTSENYPWPQYRQGATNTGRALIESTTPIIDPDPTNPGRLVNLSIRNRTVRGTGVLIAGFVLEGATGKELVVRGVGPTLENFGVAGSLEATELRVFSGGDPVNPLETNRDWTTATGDGRELGAFVLPNGSADSVVRRDFDAGRFTAQVLPATDATEPGIALVEIYDAAVDDLSTRLVNLSARTRVEANGAVTVGFVLDGTTPRTILLRAVGPGLAEFGVTGVLADPAVTLLRGQIVQAGNDDWDGNSSIIATAREVGAFPLDSSSADAALLATLIPGAYTAQVTAPADQSGVVLVEVYLVAE
jgi:outer membrane protein assembly factor BamB